MGLENLKSAFSDIIHLSEIEGRHSESSIETIPIIPSSILEATTYAYNSILDEPIEPGGGIEPFQSPLLADLYNNPETTTTLNDPASDIRFQIGFGSFQNPSTQLVVSGDGFDASLAYVRSSTGDMFVASGAVTKLGKVTDMLSKVGIDTPVFDFGAAVDAVFPPDPVPTFLTYQNQVEELTGAKDLFMTGTKYTGDKLTDSFVDGFTDPEGNEVPGGNPDSTRGIIYQVLGKQNKDGLIPDFRFQDRVENIKNIEYINPVAGFTPGNLKFKEDYFKNIGQSLGDLASAITPDFIEDFSVSDFGISNNITFENDFIKDLGKLLGGYFSNIGGFGNELPKPKLDIDIDFSGVGDFFSGIGSPEQALKNLMLDGMEYKNKPLVYERDEDEH